MKAEDLRAVAASPSMLEALARMRAAGPGSRRNLALHAAGFLQGRGVYDSAAAVLHLVEERDGLEQMVDEAGVGP